MSWNRMLERSRALFGSDKSIAVSIAQNGGGMQGVKTTREEDSAQGKARRSIHALKRSFYVLEAREANSAFSPQCLCKKFASTSQLARDSSLAPRNVAATRQASSLGSHDQDTGKRTKYLLLIPPQFT